LGSGALLHSTAEPPRQVASARDVPAVEKQAETVCGSCHRLPPPDALPRAMWSGNIARMYLLMTGQPAPIGPPEVVARAVKLPPEWLAILRYYEARAPEKLAVPEPWPAPDNRLPFRRHVLAPAKETRRPFIANVRLVDVDGDGRLEVLASDMRNGLILSGRPYEPASPLSVLATLWNPAHIEVADVDGDRVRDLLVADLGTFLPSNDEKGAVVWLRGTADGTYQQMSLDGWPRVADVQAADFDADGKVDLAVAAFGWRSVGHFTILRNEMTNPAEPSFVPHEIDARTGSIHAPPVDLNGDKRPDVVVLFSQEHETVTAFLNKGDGIAFEPQTIYTAPHPNWGSSGIQVIDFDQDKDLDVVMTNGDTLDDAILKPYHGIQWLENRGTYPFTAHEVARMPGVHRAQAADLDRDGDLDLAACALIPSDDPAMQALPALVWIEQTKPGVFERHTLKRGTPHHATLDLGDYDRDGDVDLAIGYMAASGPGDVWVEVWENLVTRRP
jgi:hypothetical protein